MLIMSVADPPSHKICGTEVEEGEVEGLLDIAGEHCHGCLKQGCRLLFIWMFVHLR